jgi:hypothetical protein
MRRVVVGLAVVMLAGGACAQLPQIGGNPASPTTSALPTLDPAVPMPAGFPGDVPVYPRARVIATSVFQSAGRMDWGVEWETTDGASRVVAFYSAQLNQGDWALTPSNQANGAAFAATFARKSNAADRGTIAINIRAGVTTIALSLISG